jgi:hypothetical protein
MRAARRWYVVSPIIIVFWASWSSISCGGNPPDKEIQQAQASIDAARAASAQTYAKDDFSASEDAIKNARAAVDARDYRLALNHALDARERADAATLAATERKTTARSDADRALRNAALALVDVRAKLRAQAGHRPAKVISAARKAVSDSEPRVQEARATFDRAEYPKVLEMLAAPTARLRESIRALDGNDAAPGVRKR